MIELLPGSQLQVRVLDHGYVQFIEDWGHGLSNEREAAIIEAARMSTNKGFLGWEEDRRLLTFLYTHDHLTPFEMAGMTIEIMAPIFVFREWHRHRTQSYNEMSGRYIALPDVNYEPDKDVLFERIHAATANRQAQSSYLHIPTDQEMNLWLANLKTSYYKAERTYQQGLSFGMPKEIARLPVPVARYSRMRASANLRNWLAFLTLRMDPAAQWEIRQYANHVGHIIGRQFPETWRLFQEKRLLPKK